MKEYFFRILAQDAGKFKDEITPIIVKIKGTVIYI